jgi:hypothetical protein
MPIILFPELEMPGLGQGFRISDLKKNNSVRKRFSINGKTNTGRALWNPVTKGPESVIPAEAGIQFLELNNRITGCPLSRA